MLSDCPDHCSFFFFCQFLPLNESPMLGFRFSNPTQHFAKANGLLNFACDACAD